MEMMMHQLVSHLRTQAEVYVFGPYTNQEVVEEQTIRPRRSGLAWFFVSAWFSCFRLLREEKFDFIIAGSTLVASIVYLLGRLFRLPMAVNVYGLDLIYAQPLYQLMLKLFLRRFDQVFAISQASKTEVLKRGVSFSDVAIVYPGLDFSEFEAQRDQETTKRQYGLTQRKILLSVGRLARRKGIPEFIQHTLPTIIQAYPEVVLLVVGDNPTQSLTHKEDVKARIETIVADLNLGEYVRLLGRVDRDTLIDLYYACDVFVLPGINVPGDMEGFGIVLTEAGAASKPVVSVKLGGIPDAVIDGKSGLLVEAERWDEFSDAVLALLKDESLCREMGGFGRVRAKAELDWPIIAEQYLEHLKDELWSFGL
jgi:phosphatidylinositol alpha-1,6-mannosyltransferase